MRSSNLTRDLSWSSSFIANAMRSKLFLIKVCTVLVVQFCSVNSQAQLSWNQAGGFPGTNGSHIAVPNSPTVNITGTFTLEAWINPFITTTIPMSVISKGAGTFTRYAMRVNNNRILLFCNTSQRLISKSSNPIPLNTWTHVAANLDTSGVYRIYINGALDTSSTFAGVFPNSGTDTLFIGSSGTANPFNGLIENVRVWNTALPQATILGLMLTPFAAGGDSPINRLVLSIPFQNNTGTGSLFSAMDHSRYGNNGLIRNVSAVNQSNNPSHIQQINDCLFTSSGGAITAPDDASLSPTTQLTIECWVFPKTDNYGLVYKGSLISANANYGLKVSSGKLQASINNVTISSNDSVKKERWSHVAFTYFAPTGGYEFFINGRRGSTGNIAPANITDGADSLLFPIFVGSPNFSGFFDELRISKTKKTIGEINSTMFTSLNESNDNDNYTTVVYNLDGSTLPSTSEGTRGNLRGIMFALTGISGATRQSPLSGLALTNFQDGFLLNAANKRVPSTGTSGIVRDTIEVLSSDALTDLDLFIAMNHSAESNIILSLKSPVGTSVDFFLNTSLSTNASNLITIFDSDADSSLVSGSYHHFGPRIKPDVDFDAAFAGINPKGKWVLTINDAVSSDTGFISAWGLRLNNSTSTPFRLECTSLIEGMYNPTSNLLTGDTMTYYLKQTDGVTIVDSAKAMLSSSGTAQPLFTKAQPMTSYFLVLKHRNSLETWSSTVISFAQLTNQASYSFQDAASKAFGNNMKQVDSSPVRFAVYSGDVNRDGTVDATDLSTIDNDAANFLGGYVLSDLTGDGFVDGTDFLIADNNAANFVSVIRP